MSNFLLWTVVAFWFFAFQINLVCFYMFTTVKFVLKTFVKPKVVFYFVLYLKIQITLLHKTFIAFIPITKLPGILVSKEFQILFAKGITSMPCRKSYFVVGPSALNCPMYLLGPRDFPGCSFWNNWFRADDTLSGNSNSWISPLINKTIFSSSPPACFLSLVVHFVPGFFVHAFGVLNLSTISSLSLVIALPTRPSLETNWNNCWEKTIFAPC